MVVVMMGPAGAGKSTVGRALAEALGCPFRDADNLHSPESIEKLRAGRRLTDEDRLPWLRRVHQEILRLASDAGGVVACSALRQRYRAILAEGVPDVRWVYLQASPDVLRSRLSTRRGHFAGPAIVDSQLEALEPPADALTLDATLPVDALVAHIRAAVTPSR
jgi:gluconokinase